ncbi:hypothetical protein F4802DRAFT_613148 [Xylaria palmicola]|nr:hypothetical protein F4802DRAFT_613148 [Xylaria palmicola]
MALPYFTEILERAGVADIVAYIPGVGEGYSDHPLFVSPYRSSLAPEETLDALAGGRLDPTQLLEENHKMLGWNAMNLTCKFRPNDADTAALGADFQHAWDRDFKTRPDKPLILMSLINAFPSVQVGLPIGQYMAVSAFSVYPYSRGYMHITGAGLNDPVDFATGFLSDPNNLDLKKCAWAYKKQREIVCRMQNYRGEPLGPDVVDIEYSPEDDRVLEDWLRKNIATAVHGVENLKIADLSIPPQNVAANTCNTAMAIGERAADIFIRELGLPVQ